MRRLLLTTTALLLLVAPAAGAAKVTALHAAGPNAGALVTDGEHAVAFQPTAGTVRVVHTNGDAVDAAAPAGCTLVAVRDDTVLWSCPTGLGDYTQRTVPVLQDTATGISSMPAGLDASPFMAKSDADQVGPRGLGRRLILGEAGGYHWTSAFLVGREDALVAPKPTPVANRVPDLDRASGDRPLCVGLTRARNAYDTSDGAPFLPFTYDPPWALTADAQGRPLVLRCGTRKVQRLACPPCVAATLAGGRLVWSDGLRDVFTRDLVRNRTRRYRVPTAAGPIHSLVAAEDAVYVVAGPYGKPSRVYRAALG